MLCRILVEFSSKSCFLKSEIHSVLHLCYKKQLGLYIPITFLHFLHRVRASKWRRRDPSYYFFFMVDVDESRSMDSSLTTSVHVRKVKPLRVLFLQTASMQRFTYRVNWATSLHTCWRKIVSVNSYVRAARLYVQCSTASHRTVPLFNLIQFSCLQTFVFTCYLYQNRVKQHIF